MFNYYDERTYVKPKSLERCVECDRRGKRFWTEGQDRQGNALCSWCSLHVDRSVL